LPVALHLRLVLLPAALHLGLLLLPAALPFRLMLLTVFPGAGCRGLTSLLRAGARSARLGLPLTATLRETSAGCRTTARKTALSITSCTNLIGDTDKDITRNQHRHGVTP
jgi:hypothetical protein